MSTTKPVRRGSSFFFLLATMLLLTFLAKSIANQGAQTATSQVATPGGHQTIGKAVLEKVQRNLGNVRPNTALLFSADGELIRTVEVSHDDVSKPISPMNYVQEHTYIGCNNPQALTALPNALACEDGRIVVVVVGGASEVPAVENAEPSVESNLDGDKKRREVPKEVLEKIEKELGRAPANSVVVFSPDGSEKSSRALSEAELSKYKSFEDFLNETQEACKKPQPISPKCVQCEDGTIICSNIKKYQPEVPKAEESFRQVNQ